MFSLVCGCLGCSGVLAVFKSRSKTDANPGYLPTRRAAGLRDNAISKCFEEWLCFFPPHSCTILHFHDYYTGLPIFPHFFSLISFFCFPSFFFLLFCLLACCDSNMLMSMGWRLLILGVSLVIRDVEYLCMFLLDIWNIFFGEVTFQVLWTIDFIFFFFVVSW